MMNHNIRLNIHVDNFKDCKAKNKICRRLHRETLKKFGVMKPLHPNQSDDLDGQSGYLISAVDDMNKNIVSSIYLHIANQTTYLPFEKILQQETGQSPNWRNDYTPYTYGEIAGCWVAHEYTGLGIPAILIRVSILIAMQCQLQRLMVFHNKMTEKHLERFGFTITHDLGNNGQIYYPDNRYLSTFRGLEIPHLPTVPLQERTLIQSLYNEPACTFIETLENNTVTIQHKLDNVHEKLVGVL